TALVLALMLNALFGIVLVAGGVWLISLGGSWYYALAGLALLVTAYLLWQRRPMALCLYAALVVLTLLWAIWESGLDWWPIAARGDVLVLLGIFMLTPWVTRPLTRRSRVSQPDSADHRPVVRDGLSVNRYATLPLTSALILFVVVAVASWFADPHGREGALPVQPVQAASATDDLPDGAWRAYGGTTHGQRYSPLAPIPPESVSRLELAWHFRTGDMRGQPGDPEETTFQVTPLKI